MALQSQMARTSSRVSGSMVSGGGRKGRAGARLLVLGGLVLTVGAGLIYVIRFHGGAVGPQEASAGITLPATSTSQPTTGTGGGPVPAPAPAAAVSATPPAPEPDIVDMGARRRAQQTPVIGTNAPGSSTPSTPSTSTAPGAPTPETTRPSLSVAPPSSVPSTQPGASPTSPAPAAPVVRDPLSTPAQNPPASPTSSAPSAAPSASLGNLPGELAALYQVGERNKAEKKLLEARTAFNRVMVDSRLGEDARASLRQTIAGINAELIFSPTVYPGDPMQDTYSVVKGDNLIRISRKLNTVTEAHFIERVNGLPNANSLKIGQKLKIVRGPFHAVVSKSGFRLDLYAGTLPTSGTLGSSGLGGGAEPGWTYIRSFQVGLGEKNGTPLGTFVVKENSKLINPHWVNPRTGQKFDKDDPKNPIGEHWIGLVGFDDASKKFDGYGIHGTIDPDSIGKEMSMGCVRLGAEDVEMVYELLMSKVSVVKIVP